MTGKCGWEDRSDVSCPARPSAQELRESSTGRAYTLTRLALTLVGCGGLLEWRQMGYQATKLPSYQATKRSLRPHTQLTSLEVI